jgi:hypothetical protein
MITKIAIIIILLLTAASSLSMAQDDGSVLVYRDKETNRTLLLPKSIVRFEDAVRNEISLEDIAKKPVEFDFDRIGKALDDTAAAEKKAYYEYVKATDLYYEMVYKKLEEGMEKMKYEGMDINGYMKAAGDEGVTWKKRREVIDEAVAFIRKAAEGDRSGSGTAGAFLTFEARCREDILDPSKELYDKRIDEAVRYVNTIVEELVESKIGLYLVKKDLRIEAIVNLSQDREG